MNKGELNELYQKAEAVDREVFAEMRSNILLVSGDHYQKRADRYFSQIRDNRDVSSETKLRLTKNHTQKITRHYETHILEYASGVSVAPQRETELQDQKSAEINNSVWQDAIHRWRLEEKRCEWVGDFVRSGEVAVYIRWNPDIGEIVGYEPLMDESGQPVLDEFGEMVPDEELPVWSGGFEFERLYAFNLLRDPAVKNMRDSDYLIYRSLVPKKQAMRMFRDDPDKQKLLVEEKGEEFIIFDASKGGYDRAASQVLFKEYFFKPSPENPKGKYVLATSAGILEETELPFGIWPIVWQGFDEHATAARARGIVKQIRPYQAEINRASSALAMHQVCIGDDKVLYQSGTKIAPGALLPGIRGISYQGAAPQILPGRDGSQFTAYIENQINELYNITDVFEIGQEKNAQFDPLALLYRSGKQRQKFNYHTKKFERFMVELCETFLKLAKEYYPDEMAIVAMGRNEMVNMAEFRSTDPLSYRIVIEPQDDTLETKFGRQVSMMHLLQYAGNNMSRDDIGMLARNLPFANSEEMFKDFTLDYDSAKNIMLALERGEMPDVDENDNPTFMIKKLSNRMRQPDFRYLPQQVQQAYFQTRQIYHQIEAQQLAKAQQAKNEFIPQDGPMIRCDMYVDSDDPEKASRRAEVPQNALNWLIKQLEFQAGGLDKLAQMNGGDMSQISDLLAQQAGPPVGQGMMQPAPAGPPMPMGGM